MNLAATNTKARTADGKNNTNINRPKFVCNDSMRIGIAMQCKFVFTQGMGVLKTKLEPELWTRRFAFRALVGI